MNKMLYSLSRPVLLAMIWACVFVFFAAASPAYAALDSAKGDELKNALSSMLDRYREDAESRGAVLEEDGEIMVEKVDYYYSVTMPHLSMRAADGSVTDIGMISINAIPGDQDGHWKITMALPNPIIHYSPEGVPVVTLSIGNQEFAGIWRSDLEGRFAKMKLHYQDVVMEFAGDVSGQNFNVTVEENEKMRIMIPDLRYVSDLQKGKNGFWSGPAEFTAENIAMTSSIMPGGVQIGEVLFESVLKDYSFDALENFEQVMEAIGTGEGVQGGAENASQDHVVGLYNTLFKGLSNLMDGFDTGLTVKDVTLNMPDVKPGGTNRVNLAKAGFDFGMKGFRGENVTMTIGMSYGGIDIYPPQEDVDAMAPTEMNVHLSVNKLPFNEMVKVGGQSLQMALTQPQMANMIGIQTLMAMPQLLTAAGTNLTIHNSYFGNARYHVALDGKIRTDMNAVNGAVGEVKMVVRGLDTLMATAKEKLADPALDPAMKEKLQQSMATMAAMQAMGQQDKDEQGRDIRVYNLDVQKDGKIMMNGTDMMTMLGGQGQNGQPHTPDSPSAGGEMP